MVGFSFVFYVLGVSLESLESLNSLESPEMDVLEKTPFPKTPFSDPQRIGFVPGAFFVFDA